MSDPLDPVSVGDRLSSRDWLAIALCGLVLAGFSLMFSRSHDVDDTLRLLQVRDWLSGQSWFDLHQYRIAPPAGVPMHWSRWVDLPLAGAMVAANWVTDPRSAEAFAVAAVPLLTLACAAALIYRAALRLFANRGTAIMAALLGGSGPALLGQMSPGRIDHHGWQSVLALVALNAMLGRSARVSGSILGASLALWLAVSIEALPLTAAFLGVLGLRWLRDPDERPWLVHASAALAICSTGLWLATHRLDSGALVGWCDVITPGHLVMLGWTAFGVAAAARIAPRGWRIDAVTLAAIAAVALAVFAAWQPQCLRGGFAQLDPLVTRIWLANVGEAMPIWARPIIPAITMALPALLGLFALAWLAWSSERTSVPRWCDYGLALLAATLLGCLLVRGFGVATAYAAPALAWGVRQAADGLANARGRVWRMTLGALLGVAVTPWLISLSVMAAQRSEPGRQPNSCDFASHADALSRLSPGTFLAPFDTGPELLLTTPHRILASGHHRAGEAMHDVLMALLGSPEDAREVVGRRRIAYVAFCFDQPEVMHYAKLASDGFLARLKRGETFPWLTPIAIPGPRAPRVWRVTL